MDRQTDRQQVREVSLYMTRPESEVISDMMIEAFVFSVYLVRVRINIMDCLKILT